MMGNHAATPQQVLVKQIPVQQDVEAHEKKIIHQLNIFGLIAVDGSHEEMGGEGRAHAWGRHWPPLTEIILVRMIVGVIIWFI